MTPEVSDQILSVFDSRLHKFKIFFGSVILFFQEEPELNGNFPVIHSIRSRIKDRDHFRKKLFRKSTQAAPISPENVFQNITDIAGIRILHLYQKQFQKIHSCIMAQVTSGNWKFFEDPKAYTWDPDSEAFFEGLGLQVMVKENHYTSIHYVIQPPNDPDVTCEIQVRTLLEEVWGEIDHTINYPEKTSLLASQEQLRVLAKFVGAGSRLADSIFCIHEAESTRKAAETVTTPVTTPAPVAAPKEKTET